MAMTADAPANTTTMHIIHDATRRAAPRRRENQGCAH
jgi:hypothetical protein